MPTNSEADSGAFPSATSKAMALVNQLLTSAALPPCLLICPQPTRNHFEYSKTNGSFEQCRNPPPLGAGLSNGVVGRGGGGSIT
ncbi:hypothetical protein VIGAN_07063100 [Vigna angularis var. angularis]|uniref:Uncharacterized protein n=1 Tax=Vigna angularis var. angularis TaxID=157739 RepID=A0A0S3SGQ6_PHAAN|nr:hypothetical protein VIGAN_07063100 [Vigna angularis var. angularis]